MPNWCKNRVDFYSENKEDLNKVLDIFSNKESIFGQIIPEPNWKTTPNKDGELPVDGEYPYPPHFPKSGQTDDRWYNWRLANWDTKWEADVTGFEVQDYDTLEIEFQTAWSPPEGVVRKLREKFPDVTFQCFYDEPGCEIAGYY